MSSTMLLMPLKAPVRNDLVVPLATWLDDDDKQVEFKPANPLQLVTPKPDFNSVACRSDLLRLSALRNCLSEALLDSHKSAIEEHNALDDCQEYHATLLEFEKRGFPTIEDECNGINLTWKAAFGKSTETHHSLVWDRACTMWNVAALQSSLVASADLSTKQGCKVAVTNAQTAASCLGILCQLIEAEDFATVDMSKAMISFWEKLLLAQGQVCIYKMANLGDTVRQHSVLAYLLQAASNLYNEALTFTQDPRLQSDVPKQSKDWGSICKSQSMICCAKAEFHISIEHRQKKQHGQEIARLRECVFKVKECQSFIQSSGVPAPEVESLYKLAQDRLQKAESDNHQFYYDTIPKSVPEIRSQQMIKTNLGMPPSMLIPKVKLFANV